MAEIAPAILTHDPGDFRKQYAELLPLAHLFRQLHVDFVDGKFLPTNTIMPGDSCRIRAPFKAVAHLMVEEPQKYFAILKNEGYSTVLIHFEAYKDKSMLFGAIQLAQTLGLQIGLAINPETKLHEVGGFLGKFSIIQLMGIHPGSQGKEFMPETLDKIRELKNLRKDAIIYVDGGMHPGPARECVEAGADVIVAGSYIVRSDHPKQAIEELLQDIQTK